MKNFRNLVRESRVEDSGFSSVAAATLKYKQNKEPMPKLKEENDTTEKTEMAETQLHFIHYAAEEILDYIEDGGEVEEWYQNKLSKVHSDMESLHSYIEGESRRTGMKEETIHVGHRNSKGDWIKTSTHSNYSDANKAMKDLESQGKKGVQHRYDNKGNIDPGMRKLAHEEVSKTAEAPKMVRDRKTGEMYDPKKKFKELMDKPETKAVMNRLAKEDVVAEGSDDKEPFDYEKWKASTVKPRKPRGYKDAEALGKAIDSEQSKLRKRKKQGVSEEVNEATAQEYSAKAKESHAKYLDHEEKFGQELKKVGERMPNSWDAAKMHTKLSGHPKYAQALKHYTQSEKHASQSIRYQDLAKKAKKIKEDVAQIDELSKKTLGNYIKSASHDVAAKGAATRQFAIDSSRQSGEQDYNAARKSMAKSDKTFSKSWKRRDNMAKAVDRLTKEDIQPLDEKNKPTNPELWSRAVAQAKSKFDVYPSAYANGWASKWYKERGGGWRSVNEAEERGTEPFLKTSRKTEIVKSIAKKKSKPEKFESDPILSSTVTRNQ
jgi:hypothetical protein